MKKMELLLVLALMSITGNSRQLKHTDPAQLPIVLQQVEFYDGEIFSEQDLDLSGRELLILDFWASWCTSCVPGIMHIDSLNQAYNGRVGFLLVNSAETDDDRTKITNYYQRWKKRNGSSLSLSTVFNDQYLTDLYKPASYPHYVWIYRGQTLAISDAKSIRSDIIDEVLKSGTFTGKEQIKKRHLQESERLSLLLQTTDTAFQSRTLFARALPEFTSIQHNRYNGSRAPSRLSLTNQSLSLLLRKAYKLYEPTSPIWIDSAAPALPLDSVYCFEWEGWASDRSKGSRVLQKVLEGEWGFIGRVENRLIETIRIEANANPGSSGEFEISGSDLASELNRVSKQPLFVEDGKTIFRIRPGSIPQRSEDILPFLQRHRIGYTIVKAELPVLIIRGR